MSAYYTQDITLIIMSIATWKIVPMTVKDVWCMPTVCGEKDYEIGEF